LIGGIVGEAMGGGKLKVVLASDHAGLELKDRLKRTLASMGVEYSDFGTDSGESVDYPDHGFRAAEAVSSGDFERGILVCGTGVGMCIVANKVRGIRAALCNSVMAAKQAREHVDSNVLCLGGKVLKGDEAEEILRTWLSTDFSGEERHARRIGKIAAGEGRWRG